MKRLRILPLILILFVSACTDRDLETVARYLLTASQALGTVQETVLLSNAVTPKLISDDATSKILPVLIQINKSGLEADKITRSIEKLAPEDRTNLTQILDPVIVSIGNAVGTLDALGITDEKTREAVRASLLLIQTSLNSAKLVLAAGRS